MDFLEKIGRNRLSFPSPGYLFNSGIEPMSPAWAGGFFVIEKPGKHSIENYSVLKRNDLLSYEKIWKKLKCIFLSE